ncbi:hypothetical protein LCGC14_1441630, partial [marine sediment metagenome]
TPTGHLPSGSVATSKSQTGALFKIVYAVASSTVSANLASNSSSSELTVYKGVTWDFTTNNASGANWTGTVKLEREYNNSAVWETVHPVVGAANKNVTVSGTEDFDDAQYRVTMSDYIAGTCDVQLSIRDTSHIGIVEITSVTSPTIAIGTVRTALGGQVDTTIPATHRWSEGAWSNFRGWPKTVTISPEERLVFSGSRSEPLTSWGSVSGNFTDMKIGSLDDDAYVFTLIGTGQQNEIQWTLPKKSLVLGTVGGEHLLGASDDNEALTPTNVQAKLQTTYGSENIQALIVNQAILFVQRGGLKIREFLYNFESDAHNADDLTIFSNHITESGIKDTAFQRTPEPVLWCVRDDGEIAVMTYERKQNVFSWCRFTTGASGKFESVAVIYGGANNEDEVWVTVKRTIDSSTKRYIERFFQRAMPSDLDDMKYLDSFLTYDSSATSTISGLTHLEGQLVQVLADGAVFDNATVTSAEIVTKLDSATTTASTVQIGLGYTSILKPMKLDIGGTGLTTTKRINRAVVNLFETIQGEIGPATDTVNTLKTGTSTLFTGSLEVSLKGGYSREGDIIVQQSSPLPSTVLSLNLDVGVYGD